MKLDPQTKWIVAVVAALWAAVWILSAWPIR
jgi:hypothetical protein